MCTKRLTASKYAPTLWSKNMTADDVAQEIDDALSSGLCILVGGPRDGDVITWQKGPTQESIEVERMRKILWGWTKDAPQRYYLVFEEGENENGTRVYAHESRSRAEVLRHMAMVYYEEEKRKRLTAKK